MSLRAEQLPDDVDALKELVLSQQAQVLQYQKESSLHQNRVAYLEEQLRLLLHKRFGASSERNADQLGLFNEAETPVEQAEDNEPPSEVSTHTRRRGKRAPLPDVLPRVEVVHELAEHERRCPQDGHALHEIGREVSEQLDVIPAKIQVIRHVRIKYGCRCCERTVKTAPMPAQPLPKSQASPGLLAHIAVAKYVDALPLYRQAGMWARVGVELDRTTLANWMVKVGELLQPLLNLLQDRLLAGPLIRMDETTVQVLNEPGRAAESTSYMWVRVGGDPPQRIILFDYEPTRHSATPKRLLAGFSGVLLTDGYEGYGAAVREQGLAHAGCWAHARRKFDEALKARAKSKQGGGKAGKGLAFIGKLYQIEHGLKDASAQQRYQARQASAKPIVEELRAWLDASIAQVPPTSLTGKALHYLHGQWPKLVRYLDDGHIPMDNNLAENAIRPFVLGRKNWLFANSQAGARSSAAIYSIIQTAKANGLEPFGYLKHVLTQLPKADSLEDIEALLPFGSTVNCALG